MENKTNTLLVVYQNFDPAQLLSAVQKLKPTGLIGEYEILCRIQTALQVVHRSCV